MAAAVVVPAAWFVPELVGSGDVLRSAARAQVPNPGQPALADLPALASLQAAAALPLWPLWVGVALAVPQAWARRDRAASAVLLPAAVGLAWIGLVAAMAAAGFSGEPRYALPGAALVAVSGAAGLVTAARHVVRWPGIVTGLAALLIVAVVAAPRRPAGAGSGRSRLTSGSSSQTSPGRWRDWGDGRRSSPAASPMSDRCAVRSWPTTWAWPSTRSNRTGGPILPE